MKRELAGNMVLDAGPVVEFLFSTIGGIKVKDALKAEKIQVNITEVTLAEVRYVLCRKLGFEESRTRIKNVLESGYLSVHEISRLVEVAAEYKCKRSLSLADCFALALAKTMDMPVLFSRREDDLLTEMSRETVDTEILFLEDIS